MTRKLKRVGKIVAAVRTRGLRVRDEYGVSIPRQLTQMLWFFRQLRTTEHEFYDFRLYDQAQPLDERLKYLSWKRWLAAHQRLNPVKDRTVVKNKSVFASAMGDAGIPIPATLGVIDLRNGVQGVRETLAAAAGTTGAVEKGIVIKPESGSNVGRGVIVFRRVDTGGATLTTMGGQEYDPARLHDELLQGIPGWDKLPRRIDRYIVQPRLTSHQTLRGLNPNTLCTVRIVTLTRTGGSIDILGSSFKVGVGSKGTDNYNDGGIAVSVDLATGRLGTGLRKYDDTAYTRQPDTGVTFEGMTLPFWTEAVALVRRAAAALPQLRTLGWDVALTDAGAVIVEANPDWACDLIQRPQRRGIWRPPLTTAHEEVLSQRRPGTR
jgi:hypothetical protein